jgi:hypothetical protein
MTKTFSPLIIVTLVALAMLSLALCPAATAKVDYHPDIDPADFVGVIDNPYFPLTPGTTYFYEGETEGEPTQDIVYVTFDTKLILGVTCVVVLDRAYTNGILGEETLDWYAQDECGNVWYFGEDSKLFDEFGNVISTEGSWEAGVAGAYPGIIMKACPRPGRPYRQEFAPDVAEDMARVLPINPKKTITVPYGEFNHLVLTKEWSPLDPGVVEHKYYAPGIGFIKSIAVKGEDEYSELVDITTE